MEPIGIKKERDEIECFLIPCVATTLDKYRIGYGKGYYDRYLEGYKGKKIGITYKNTSLECKADSYDVLLDIVLMG
jgi:5-formyltetrahydrofolate cyclo-ligase